MEVLIALEGDAELPADKAVHAIRRHERQCCVPTSVSMNRMGLFQPSGVSMPRRRS